VAVQADIGERLAYRVDRNVIERAARALRDYAIRDGYSGSEQPARAFSLALLVDELGRHVRDLDDELRPRRPGVPGCCWARLPDVNGSAPAPGL
jgi:heterodisulfide reductase subunit C